MKNINCLRCKSKMEFVATEKIQLGETSWLLKDLPNLFAGSMEVNIYICPECKKIELFSSDDNENDEEPIVPYKKAQPSWW
jgi:hypothetical protein